MSSSFNRRLRNLAARHHGGCEDCAHIEMCAVPHGHAVRRHCRTEESVLVVVPSGEHLGPESDHGVKLHCQDCHGWWLEHGHFVDDMSRSSGG